MNKLLLDKKEINIINENKNLDLVLEKQSEVVINYFNTINKDININLVQEENSHLIINMACLINKDCEVKINVLIKGNNNKCIINIRAIGINEVGKFNVSVKSLENTEGNEIIEDLKGVCEDGGINFLPILEIDTNEVEASHFATIGSYNPNQIFYLQSKGLSYEECLKLLKRSFIYQIFNKEFISLIERKIENE